MRIAIGSDHRGCKLKELVIRILEEHGYSYHDFGCYDEEAVDYPDIGVKVAGAVAGGEFDRGILICGTGIGMSISANKVPGAYAALCADPYSTERSRKSNNANIMTLGSQVIGPELAKSLVTSWMASEYTPGGRSEPKIQRIYDYAEEHQK